MRAKKYIILGVLVFVSIAIGTALSQVGTMPPGQTVDITKVSGNLKANGQSPLTIDIYPPACPSTYDINFFNNNTGITLRIRNTVWPGATQFPQQNGIANNATSTNYSFCCSKDGGRWEFMVEDNATGSPAVQVIVLAHCPTPSLSSWGIIILIALILATGVYLWLRKRPVPA